MGCKARWVRADATRRAAPQSGERNAPPDVEPAGAATFRIVGETNGGAYQAGATTNAALS